MSHGENFEQNRHGHNQGKTRGNKEKRERKDDIVGSPLIDEVLFQEELQNGSSARVDARHLRVTPERMQEILLEEKRQNGAREKEKQLFKTREELRNNREELQEFKEKKVRLDAWKYAEQLKEKAKKEERPPRPEERHERELAAINAQLSEVIALHTEKKNDFWGFLPGRRRERAKLEEQIQELRTRERVERMRIAELTGEYHRDVEKKKARQEMRKNLEPFFDALRKPEKPAANLREVAEVSKEIIRTLYREKAKLEAERESLFMAVRPFRARAIDTRLEEIVGELKKLQQEVRETR